MVESLVTAQEDFAGVCDAIREAGIVAVDTEFVSEGYYRPQLCLLQLAVPGREVVPVTDAVVRFVSLVGYFGHF